MITLVTAREGEKVEEIVHNPNVGITLQSRASFVALHGKARIVANVEEKRRVWRKMKELWFDRPEDPQAVLIQVSPYRVEYWDQRGMNALRFAFSAAQAAARGGTPEVSARQHGDANFR
jgi:general stress protein 26